MGRTSRCYNCGIPGHQTEACPNYGPRYPAPGKTSADYVKQAEKINNLIAADIINEHRDEEDVERDRKSHLQRVRRQQRTGRVGQAGEADGDGEGSPGGEPTREDGGVDG